MSTNVTLNGTSYTIPAVGDAAWGPSVSNYLIAIASATLQKSGGAFTLAQEVNFGATYGLKLPYVKSSGATVAAAGVLRLANGDNLSWRNAANSADLALSVNGSNQLTFGGTVIPAGIVSPAAGGTGIANNAASTITVSGAYPLALTLSSGTTVTLPTSGTLATLAGSETLTNKTLTSPVISTIVNTGTLTLPTATDTLVARTTTDTLTNKTLSTGTSITAGKITTAVAEVDPADNTKQWNADLSTSTTSTSTTFKLAQTANRTLTFPDATDTMVGRATTDTLTNKTLTTPVQTSYEDWTQVATPASPTSGKDRLYFKSDDNLYRLTSAGIEQQIGSGAGGSGQKNYVSTSASNTAATWTTYGTVAATTDTTAADLPRATTTASGWKLTPSGSTSGTFTVTLATPGVFTATAHGMLTGYTVTFSTTGALPTGLTAGTVYYVNVLTSSTFNVATSMANLIAGTFVATSGSQSGTHSFTFGGAYLRFTLDAADYNVKQQLQWAQNILSGATGDWEVDVYSNTASNYSGTYTRLPLSTDSSGSTALPNLEGTFRTTFDAPGAAQQYIELRWNKLAANTHALVGSDLISGPGVSVQGAAVSVWTSYTPVFTGLGTVTNAAAEWRRVGDTVEVRGSVTGGTVTASLVSATLPNSYTVNSTALSLNNLSSAPGNIIGQFTNDTSTGIGWVVTAPATSTSVVYFAGKSAGSAGATPAAGTTIANNTSALPFSFVVAVNELAGSGTVNVAQNDISYYYGTGGTWGTSGTITTAQGPGGGLLGTTTPSGNFFSFTLTPTYPIPVGAKPVLEISVDGTHWGPVGANPSGQFVENLRYDGTNYIGASVGHNSAGQLVLMFGKYAAGTAQSWGGTLYYRIAVGLPGQAVGFGIVQPGVSSGLVSASGLPGNTTGNAIAAGYVGEQKSANSGGSATYVSTNTSTNTTIVSLTLTAGVWLVSAAGQFANNATQTGYTAYFYVKGSQPSGLVGVDQLFLRDGGTSAAACPFTFPSQVVVVASGDADKTVAVQGISITASGQMAAAIFAVRIA